VGNIVGVATAIGIGGPGALFWMWVTGLLGMASKYTEAFLGVRFRTSDEHGERNGGPQYYLEKGIKGPVGKILAWAFTIFTVLACFGIGNMTQANAIAENSERSFGANPMWVGIILAILTGVVLIGGIKSIGRVTAGFVPFMIIIYVVSALYILGVNFEAVPAAFAQVFTDAFTGTAATGGFLGSVFIIAVQYGFARGIFSNESGMGSAAIAAASAQTSHPVRQGQKLIQRLGARIAPPPLARRPHDAIVILTKRHFAALAIDFRRRSQQKRPPIPRTGLQDRLCAADNALNRPNRLLNDQTNSDR